jgi:hypothetical protein
MRPAGERPASGISASDNSYESVGFIAGVSCANGAFETPCVALT